MIAALAARVPGVPSSTSASSTVAVHPVEFAQQGRRRRLFGDANFADEDRVGTRLVGDCGEVDQAASKLGQARALVIARAASLGRGVQLSCRYKKWPSLGRKRHPDQREEQATIVLGPLKP